ncbi:hypothetical protein BN1708_018975, partial [Verticillium longisporum]
GCHLCACQASRDARHRDRGLGHTFGDWVRRHVLGRRKPMRHQWCRLSAVQWQWFCLQVFGELPVRSCPQSPRCWRSGNRLPALRHRRPQRHERCFLPRRFIHLRGCYPRGRHFE